MRFLQASEHREIEKSKNKLELEKKTGFMSAIFLVYLLFAGSYVIVKIFQINKFHLYCIIFA